MTVERHDLEVAVYELKGRLDEMERHQWTANGRMRQDAATIASGITLLTAAVVAMWAGVQFRWWYVPIATTAILFFNGWSAAYYQEQRRSR
jgi:hypothetical protein